MQRGVDFLKSQIANAVGQHRLFLQSLEDHESQASDQRYRDLCMRFIPRAVEHQHLLEDYERSLGSRTDEGLMKR